MKNKGRLNALCVSSDILNSDAYGYNLNSDARLLRVKSSKGQLRALYVDNDNGNSYADGNGSLYDNARLLKVRK